MGISFSAQSVRVWWWTFSMLCSIPTSSPSLSQKDNILFRLSKRHDF